MNTKNFKKVISIALSAALTLGVMATSMAFAASDDATRQANSSGTATITMSKILTASQAGKFPNITDFNYTLERIKGWKNANVSTAANGEALAKSAIPMPAASSTANHTVTVSGDTATVAIGNFNAAGAGDTTTQKERETAVPITFTDAGYYVYKVKEVSSTPANVPGLTYDDHEYFIVVYVCNNIDAQGNTVDGVYVHSITSYRNESGSDTYQPTLDEIAYTADHNGAAQTNDRTNLDKVGLSSAEHPNQLDADNMWNDMVTSDLTISKNVKGSLGDVTKEFEFTVTLTGLQPSTNYTIAGNGLSGVQTPTVGSFTSPTLTTNNAGSATFVVKLKDGESITVQGLNATSHYTVSEAASDHVASLALTAEGQNAVIATGTSGNGIAANNAAQTALATAQETIDAADGNQTVAYTNTRSITTITGVQSQMAALIVAAAIAAIAAGLFVARRKSYEED